MIDLINKYVLLIGFAIIAVAIYGCESMQYYGQAIQGQYSIIEKRRPISDIMADPHTPENLRDKLAYILGVRQFAEKELRLPVQNNYLTYVDLERPYVVWNVFAAEEFSLAPKTWCYPIVGCAAYRGYFSEQNARQYANGLSNQGYEVYVAGVTAYSTLGWFDDPVLSTFIQYPKPQSAALIFHELAHQVLYIKGDTTFNESFATAVEQEGLQRWQTAAGSPGIYRNYLNSYRRRQRFVKLIMQYRQLLETLYQSNASAMDMRNKKASIFSDLRDEFNKLKTAQNGLSVYNNWINHSLNNAKIGSVAAYHDLVPAFQKLLANNNGDLNRFYTACRNLAELPDGERHRILNSHLAD